MYKLRLISQRKGYILTNPCGRELEEGFPMVGCRYCMDRCPYNKGVIKFLFWKFVKCKY